MAVSLTVVGIFVAAITTLMVAGRRWGWFVGFAAGAVAAVLCWAAASLGWLFWFANA